MYVFSEPVLHTQYLTTTLLYLNWIQILEKICIFSPHISFQDLAIYLWVKSPVHGVLTTLHFSSFRALSCDPSHISHSYQSLLYQTTAISLLFLFSLSLTLPSYPACAVKFLSSPDYNSPYCVLPYLPLLVVVPSSPDCCSFVLCSPSPTSCYNPYSSRQLFLFFQCSLSPTSPFLSVIPLLCCVLPLSTPCCSSFSALSMFCTRHITILGFHSPDVGCMQDSRKHHRLSILRTLFRISLM